MRARLAGLLFLALGALLGGLVFQLGAHSAKALVGAPLLGATGLWMLVFGHPVGEDGMAPAWWRLGLVAFVIVSCAGTCMAIE